MSLVDSVRSFLGKYDIPRSIFNLPVASANAKIDEETPLVSVLKSARCPLDIIQLLIDHGADVNSWNITDGSPLLVALAYSRDEAIIEMLLQKGAETDIHVCGRTPMCYALCHGASKEVVRLLLEFGCSPNACSLHNSLLHCATFPPHLGLKEGVLELLIKAGADLSHFEDQSPICLALKAGAGAHDIQLLVKEGVGLDSCLEHGSPWFCATNRTCKMRLRTDVVELLLDAKVSMDVVNEDGWNPLQCALCDCNYQKRAIKLMLDKVNVSNDILNNKYALLHLAVGNDHCKLSVVKLLIERGLKVDQLNCCMETPLHRAVMSSCSNQKGIIDLLLRKSNLVNFVNMGGLTPLRKAVDLANDCDVIQMLLAAGALVDDSLLKFAVKQYKENQNDYHLAVLKMLVKYSFLRNINFEIKNFIGGLDDYEAFANFAADCVLEVLKLESAIIGQNYSLRSFVNDHSTFKMPFETCGSEASRYDFNRLLIIMDNTDFPIYFDVISAKFGNIMLKMKLNEYEVYALKYSHFPNVAKKIILDYDSLFCISTYLSHVDLLRIIIAYAC